MMSMKQAKHIIRDMKSWDNTRHIAANFLKEMKVAMFCETPGGSGIDWTFVHHAVTRMNVEDTIQARPNRNIFRLTDPSTNSFQLNPPLLPLPAFTNYEVITKELSCWNYMVVCEYKQIWRAIACILKPILLRERIYRDIVTQKTSFWQIMTSTTKDNNPELSPTSPGEDSDVTFSPAAEIEPVPGLNGVPVRCTWISKMHAATCSVFYESDLGGFLSSNRVWCMWRS